MKTNNFFDPCRFFGLLRQDILFNYRFYLSFVAGLSIGIYVFSYLLIRNADPTTSYQYVYFILNNLLLGATTVFIGMSFPAFRNQMNTSHFLLTPGSALEKMMIQFVVRFVLFIPLALLLLRVGIFLAVSSMLPDPKSGFDPLFVDDFSYSAPFIGLNMNSLSILALPLFAFASSVHFKRYAVAKTLGILVLFSCILLLILELSGGFNRIAVIPDEWIRRRLLLGIFYFRLSPILLGIVIMSLP